MQSIRNSGEARSERVESARPRQHGLFNSTALIPAMAAFAGGAGRLGAASLMHSTALVPAAIAVTAASLLVMPDIALAQTTGGRGGNNLGSGGASSETGVGADGAGNANSGGGGGAGVIGGKGGNSGGEGGASAGANGSAGVAAGSGGGGGAHGYFGATVLGSAAIGGSGGAGAVSAAGANRGGGGGGAGGFGAVITGIGNLGSLNVNVLGGTGGLGGNGGAGSFGGYGGSGGVGLALTGNAANLTINSSVTGGNGGSGGAIGSAGGGAAGVAGNGGVGLHVLGANSIVTIGSSGSVTGGNSGPALNGAEQSDGGVGITGSNLTLVVGGSVSAGTGVFGRANAVRFTGGTNVLEILSGATFLGNVVASSAADTLRLGGTANGTFDASLIGSTAQFRNFGVYEKTGTSTWTLTGSTSAATPWAINGGTLSIASDGALGASGPISFNGGTLVTTAGFSSARNITLNASGGTISPATATSLTLSGIIGGTGALTKGGVGTLILSGANTYSGGTTVAAGTLVVAHNAALGTAAGETSVANFATLAVQGGLTGLGEAITLRSVGVSGGGALRNLSGDNVLTGAITLASVSRINSDAGTLNLAGSISAVDTSVIVGGAGNVTFSGSVSLAGGQILKNGSGTLTFGSGLNLTGTTGGLILSQGTLSLQGNLGAGFGTILTNGSVIDFAQGINNAARVDLNSNTTQFQVTTGTATQSGIIAEIGGARPIEKIGAGSLILSGVNSYSGGTVISGGTLRIGADANLGAASGGITINNNANLTFTSALTTNRAITLSGTANIDSSSDITLAGVIGGTGTLTKFLGGTLTLTNTNNYSGGTTVNGGALQIGNGGTTGTLGSGTVTLNGANLIFNRSDDITVANDVTSTGTVIKRGGGTVTLTGGKSYSNTFVEAGTLALRGTSPLSGGGVLQLTGGTLDMGVDGAISSATHTGGTLALGGRTLSVITGNYALQSGSITGGGTIALLGNSRNFNIGSTTASIAADVTIRSVGINNAVFITSPGGDYTLASNLDGSGALSAAGSLSVLINNFGFTTTLSGNNNHRLGTTVNSGTIAVGSDTALGTGTLFLNPNTALTAVGLRSIANAIELVAGDTTIRNTDTSNTFTLGGVISGVTGLIKTGAGTLILTGANTYQGGTTISDGTLQIGAGGTSGTLGSGGVTNNAALAFNRSNDFTVANAISGTGNVVKAGTGTLTLSGASNYTGGTTVNSGTLALAGASSAGTGTIRMNSGALQANSSFTLTNRLTVPQGADVRIVTAPGVTLTKTGDGTNPLDLVGTLRIATTGTGVNAGTFRFSSAATTTGSARLIIESGTLLNTTSVVLPGILNLIELTQIDAAGTLNLGGINFSGTDGIKNLQGSGTLINNGATTRILGGSFSGNLSGTQNIISTGTLSLSGTSDFTGTTTVQSGTLTVSSAGALGTSASGTTVNSGATLLIAGASPSITISDALTISGSGDGGIGALRVEPNAIPGNQGVNLTGGVTLAADSTITVTDRLVTAFTSGQIQLGTSTLTFNSEGTGNSTTRVNSVISGTGGVIKNGRGLLEFNAANTFAGPLTLNAGQLVLSGGAAIADLVAVTMATNSTLDVTASETIGSLAGAGVVTLRNNSTLTMGGDNGSTIFGGGILTATTGTGSLVKTGTGTLILTSGNVFRDTTINGGTLQIGNGGTTGTIDNATITNNANLTFNRSSSVLSAASISGTGSLTKLGAGQLTLTGVNSYAGNTNVVEGRLVASSSTSLGSGAGIVTVSDGAQLELFNVGTVGHRFVLGGIGIGVNGTGALNATLGTQTLTGNIELLTDTRIRMSPNVTLNLAGSLFNGNNRTLLLELGVNRTMTISSSITGLQRLETTGQGTLTLSGTNTLIQSLDIFSSRVNAQMGSAIPDTAAVNMTGTLDIQGAVVETIGSLAGRGSVLISDPLGTLRVGNDNTSTLFTGSIGGPGVLIKTGTGTLTLSGTNTFGATTISSGTLRIGNGGTTGTLGSGNVLNNFALEFNRSNDFSVSNAISGAGTLTKLGEGNLTLSGTNAYSGLTTVSAGTLTVNSDGALGNNVAGTTVSSGATLAFGTAGTIADAISFRGTGVGGVGALNALGSVNLDGNVLLEADGLVSVQNGQLIRFRGSSFGALGNAVLTLNTDGNSSIFVNSALGGIGGLIKNGAGQVQLAGNNSFTGPVTINAGVLQVTGGNAINDSVAITGVGSGRLSLDASEAIGSIAGTGSIGLFNNSILTTGGNNSSTSYSGQILSTGSLVKIGTGTFTLTGDSSYLGTTTISGGTLQIGDGGPTGTLASGTVTNNATLAINLSSDITLSQAITGTGALRKLGSGVATVSSNLALGSATVEAGTLLLSGSNSFTNGITVAGGTLALRNVNAAGGATGLIRTTGSVIDYSDGLTMATPVTLASNTTQLQVLTGSATQSGVISEEGGARPLEKIGAGTLTLSGVNSYSGGTTITAGRLNISSNANLGATAGGLTIGNGVLGATAIISSARAVTLTGAAGFDIGAGLALTLTGAVNGAGSLAKTGAGQLILTANNGYTGATTISGFLGMTVGNGGTTGTLGAGDITINSGSFLNYSRSDAFTVANLISGQGSLSFQGTGTLTLTGANSFTGGFGFGSGTAVLASASSGVINAAGTGRIRLSQNAVLRTDVSGSLVNDLVVSGASTVAAATGTTLRLASNQVSFDGGPLNFGTSSAAGTIELAPVTVASVPGSIPVNINGITLKLANTAAYTLLNGGNGVFLNGATLVADVAGTLTKPLTIGATGGTIDVAAASMTLQGANSYTGVLTKTGTGELRLTGAGTGSGTVQLNAGTLALLASNARWGTGTLQMATGTTLRLGLPSPATLANNIVLGAGAGSTIIASSTTFSGALSGGALTIASGLDADGPSVVRLTGTNSYGATTIGAGNTLLIGAVGSGGTLGTGNVTVNTGATLRFEGNNNTVGNVITGAGRLVRDGIGTTTLTAVNSYAGGTLISGGGITIGNAGALGSGGLTMTGTSSLTTATGVSATVTGVTIGNFASSSISAAAGQTLSLGGTLDLSSFANSLVFGTLVQTGTVQIGFAPATGPVTNASLRIDAGTLRLASASDAFLLRLGGGMTIGSPGGVLNGIIGTFDLNGFAGGGVNLNGLGAITNSSGTLAQFEALQNAASTFGGTIGGGTGAISLLKSGTGALTLTGANSYTGTTSITGGSLQIGNGGTTGSLGTGAVSIASGTQLLLNRSDAVSLANIFTGAGAVQKNLANTLTLTGSNTSGNAFTGTFNVNAGTLLVNGTLGDVTSRAATINVASGAALGGSGTIQGNVVVANGGILSPGNSPATQTIAGNLTLNASSVLNFELAQAGAVGGGINDLISVGGNLVLDGTLNVTALPGFGTGFYRLFNYGGTLTDNTLNLGTLPLGFTSSVLTNIAGQVNILFNAGTQIVQYWDGTDLTGAIATVNGDGGGGSWTSAATNWTNPTGFAVNSSWAGQAGVFAGAAGGSIGITGSQAFQELRFLTSGYTLNANNAASGLATTGGFSIINVDSGIATLINAPISGSAGLTKTGGGTLTLGGANSYAGLTTVSGGTLSLTSGGAIAGAVQNNATLTNAGTISGLVTNSGTLTSTGTLAGGLTNNAGATANVAGSFGGNAIINSGTLTLTGMTGGIGAVTQNVGGTINLGGQSVSFGSLAGTGTINQSGPGVLTIGGNNASTSFAGNFTGSFGSIVKTGTGTQTLSGSSSWTGLTTVDGGTLSITGAGSLAGRVLNRASFTNAGIVAGSVINAATLVSTGVIGGGLTNNAGAIASIAGQLNGAVNNTGTITLTGITTGMTNVENNGTLNLAGFDTSIGSLGGTGGIALGNGLLTVGASNGAQLFDGIISGTGGLVKVNAASTLELRGANSYAGLTTISGGRLIVSDSGRLAGPVQNNATFIVDDAVIAGLVTNAGTLVSTGALNGGLVNSSGANAGLRGTLSGPVSNSGTITLTGITTGNAAVTQTGTGTFNMAGFNATIGSLAGSGQVQLGSGTLTLGGANTSTDFGGVISGSGALVKTGTATQTLSGANTFTGLTSITQGSIFLATGASLASAVQNNATFINAGTTTGLVTNAGTLSSAGTLAGGLVNNAGASASLANTVNGAITNSGTITLTAGLSGSPTFIQNTGASLNLAGFSATLGSIAGSGTIQLGTGTLTAGSDNSSTSFDGVFSGSGSFTKTGSGALTLGGSNTAESNFTGTVNVNSGSLVLNGRLGDAVANSATLNVANGATLSGSGTFLGNLALGTGGIFAPGNSPGTLAIGGNLLLDATSVLNFELAQAGVVGGGINDLITVGGNLTLDGTLNVAALPGFGDGIYRLVNYAGALTDNGLAFGLRPDGYTASLITNVAGQVSVQFTLGVPTVLYWDGTDTTAASNAVNGDGGSGTWNSTTTNWTSAPGFSTSFAWGSQTGVFAGAAGGTVQVSGTQAFQQLRFETGGYVLGTAAGGGALATTGGTSIIDVSAGLAATINTPIQGTAGLTKAGTGTLTLGGANSYAGLTSIASGALVLGSGGVIAGAVENNASFTNNGTVQGLVTNAGTLRSTGTLSAGLTNNTGVVADLSGVLNGNVSNAGTVRLIGSIGGNATFNQLGTGVFDLAGSTASVGALSGAGSVQLGTGSLVIGSNNATTSFTGVIAGSGGIEKLGTGALTLTGANTFAGRTLVSAGSLTLASGGSLAGPVTNNAVFTNAGTVAGAVTNSGTLVSTGAINGGLINNAGASANISGVLAGNAINRGTITLTGATTGIAELSMAAGGTFNLGGFATTIGNLTGGGGTIALGSATLTLGSGNQSQTYDGTITGTGGLTKVSASTFSLSGAQGYTGLTTVNGGSFILGSNGSLAGALVNNATVSTNGRIAGLVTNNATLISTGALDGGLVNAAGASANIRGTLAGAVSNAGTLSLTGATTGIGAVTQASTGSFNTGGFSTSLGSLAGSGTVRLANGAVLTIGGNNGSTSFGGLITGNGALTKTGTGTFTLTAVQDFTGLTTVGAGTLALGTGASLAGGVVNNATVTNAGTIAGAVTNTGALVSIGTLSGALANAAGATAQILGQLNNAVSNAGTIMLTGTTTGIGAVSQDATGVLALGGFNTSIGSLSGSGSVQLGAGVLTTGGNNNATSFAGVLSGTGGLIKTGNGSFALSGANSYAGLTTVNQGVLSVRNNAALGTAAAGTVVAAGAALELQGGVTVTGEALTISGTGVSGAGALRNVADSNIWAGTVTLASDSLITADAGRLDIELLAGTSQALTTGGAGLIGLANATSAGTLIVTGGSTALFGTGNFAAGVTVNAGSLFLQGGTSIDDAAAVALGTGNLIVAVSETIGSLAGAGGTVQIDAGQTLSLGGNNGSTSFGGVIFNTGNLAKQGTGTFTVTGSLAHSGTTAITGGTLLSGAANIWSGNGLVTIATGGTLDLGGFEQGIASISLAGGTLANGALTGSISSIGGTIRDISGTANALRAIGGTTTLTGAGSFAQGVTLAGGDVVLQGAGASIADSALVTVDTGTLAVNIGETIGALAGSGGRVQIAANQTLTTGGSNASSAYAGVLAGNGSVIKTGTGTFTLSGVNTLTGPITVNAGVLALASGGSLAGAVQNNAGFSNAGTVAGLVTNAGMLISTGILNAGLANSGSAGLSGQLNGVVSNSGLVQLQGALTGITAFNQTGNGMFDLAGFNTSIGSLSGAGTVLLGSATLTLGSSNASTSFGGTIGGTGGLIKTGSGTFTLTSGQGYTGLTTVNAGLLSLTANAGLSGSVLNNAGFASSGLILGSLTNNGTATLAGQINGAVINGGSITASGQLIVQGRLTQNAGGSTNLAGFNASLGSLAGVGPIQLGSGTLVVGSDSSSSLFSGVISGSGGLQKLGTGTFTLTGINSYTGITIVNAGTLVIGEGASVGGTTGSVTATVAAPSSVIAPVAVAASTPLVAEQARMPEAVTLLAATSATAANAPAVAAATNTAATASPSLAARAGMIVDNGAIAGGLTPASLTSSAERLPLAGGVSSGPERVDLFGDPVSGAVSADLPVVTLGEAAQSVAPAAISTANPAAAAAGRLAMLSDLSNGLGTARLDNGLGAGVLQGGAEAASPVAAAQVDPAATAPTAGEAAMASTLSTAVIAGSVINNANLINHGSILGQLVNSAGATALNNGVIRGLVTNNGIFTSVGTLSGGLANGGTARISGVLTGDVFNSGSITLTGLTTGIALFQQAATGSLNLGGFDTTLGVLSGAGTVTLGGARLTTGTNGVNSLFSGVISGSGALTKTGTGGLILDGDNSYTGGTTIAGGSLQLGNGGTTGSIIGPVLNNGALIINRSNGYTFAGAISGTGMFVQAGTGTTTLTGANSYTGGTLISAGRLIGSTVSLQGLIQNDAALEFAQGTNGVFAGRIGGTGLFDKTGAGLLELTGDNSALRGATAVRAGELRVTGSLAGSATTVLSGATLSGTGTVGGLVARSGSVVAPGANGLGMLGVNGAIQLQQGSALRLQVQAPSGSDMLIGNGTMQLGGTAAITNLGGTYAFNSNYLLLQASGGRTGTFDTVTGFGEFGILYRPELVYTANQVLLRMAPNLLTNIVGATPLTANQRSVVSRIDAAVTAGYNPQPLFNVYALPNAQQPNAFDQLSGEVYATAAGVGIEQERLVREAVLGRIGAVAAASRQTPEWGNGAGAWGQVFGSWGDGKRDGNAARYESDRQGFITGIDYGNANSEGSWRIGAFGMHMTSKVSVDARGSRTEVEQTGGGIYAGVNSGGLSVAMGASVTGVDLTSVRNIVLPGFAETNRGRGDGRAVQGFAELSYAIDAGNATYRPFASVAAGSFKLDALTETGGAAALSVRRQSYSSGSITMGADGVVRMGKVQLSGTLAGRVQIGDRDPAARIALAAAPAQAFTVRGVQLDSFALAARLDATLKLGSHADLSLGYTGLIGNDTADHGARATLSVRF